MQPRYGAQADGETETGNKDCEYKLGELEESGLCGCRYSWRYEKSSWKTRLG